MDGFINTLLLIIRFLISSQVLLFLGCFSGTSGLAQSFEPPDGQCFVFVGQDLAATGGLEVYREGYSDYFETPAGVTVYTNLAPGGESFGHHFSGLDGLLQQANWGAGDCWANAYLQDSTYQYSMMAIGLSMVHCEKDIAKGRHDDFIVHLATWIQGAKRPVFLRIGYEFDGWEWNQYRRRFYLQAWTRIYKIFQDMGVENVAYIWQSKGTGSDQNTLEAWYPGDEIVDWCAYSYFGSPDTEMITFARNHQKPVFIAEATPVREFDGLYFETDLNKTPLDQQIWEGWFVPFFQTIQDNNDVIKAFSYINTDWSSQPMWVVHPVFQRVDSRLQLSPYIMEKWREKLADPAFLQASDIREKMPDQ